MISVIPHNYTSSTKCLCQILRMSMLIMCLAGVLPISALHKDHERSSNCRFVVVKGWAIYAGFMFLLQFACIGVIIYAMSACRVSTWAW